MTISFTVDGVPVPQSRPRFTKQGRAYDTKACKDYKRDEDLEPEKVLFFDEYVVVL